MGQERGSRGTATGVCAGQRAHTGQQRGMHGTAVGVRTGQQRGARDGSGARGTAVGACGAAALAVVTLSCNSSMSKYSFDLILL